MSTVPNPACGNELGVVGLGAPASAHSTPFFSIPNPGLSAQRGHSDPALLRLLESEADQYTSKRAANGCGSAPSNLGQKLNRIAEVRKSQGLSERTICKRLQVDIQTLRELEEPTRDLTVSELIRVQSALEVPLVDLLEDSNSLARPIQERAKMVRIMKTVAALDECLLSTRPKRLVSMLREQLVELMPELADVGSWPQYGSRRGAASIARVLEQEINLTQISTHD